MAMTMETAQLNNQSILESFGLVEELNEQAAEIISGGVINFTVENATSRFVWHRLNNSTNVITPGEKRTCASNTNPGIIEFDANPRLFGIQLTSKEVVAGGTYKFQPKATDPNLIELVG
ncbi:MAG: hypothetical protein RMZ41_006565 [Nostoc sp. DedVER02]|uniref:hypothetical protein n=1 Tax=unclassified Nostoc TaxID=2593658 RepID=UPI002AD39D8E|nr:MULTISPECIES: hypothetical protein [unclassified Nostoc]MDZ7985924.1 hypothetical protein [Nostoc sp. DedVER02]MDZ8111517.1 hypothetical protein [Nostoc sp. DedVER01b]